MAVSKRLRYEILRRDNHACRYCGATAPEATLTVDHVVPTALGGSDDPTNLVAACKDCNAGKSSSNPDAPLVADVSADALRWSRAMAQAAENMLADHDRRSEMLDEFTAKWDTWKTGGCDPVPLPTGWQNSVDRLLAAGLPMPVLLDCIDIAMGTTTLAVKNIFRYTCGVAWRRVADLQESARAIAARSAPPPCMLIDADQKCGGEATYRFWLTDCTMCEGAECGGHFGFCERHMEGAVKAGAIYNSDHDVVQKIADFAQAVTA
jgi:hypothetical protein